MAYNGGEEVKTEYTEEYQTDYVEQSAEYQELVGLGLAEQVARELDELFQAGMMRRDEVDQRALDGLRGLSPEAGSAVLAELKGSSLQSVSNKSAYMCGIMKSHRQKAAAGLIAESTKRAGPDESKLKEILDRTGYSLEITSGQRKYGGPPPNYTGPPPSAGQEVFCGKIPNSLFEDALIPLFEKCGTVWDLRLMMDPSTGLNKTFCFVMFTSKEGAQNAVKQLDNYEIRPGKRLKVNISIAKVRLFVGNIPKQRSKDEIMAEFAKMSEGLSDVLVYSNPDDPMKKNRGFAFLDYDTHKNAAAAKRKMESGQVAAWGRQFVVSWAEPQEEPDAETMAKVKVLYVKNLKSLVSEDELRQVFEPYGQVGRVKKTKDYGFIHFENREDALRAMEELNGTNLGDTTLDISLAKPPSMKKKMQDPRMGGGWGQSMQGGSRGGFGGRGRGRGGSMMGSMMGYGGGGYGGSQGMFDPYGYDSYGYDDYYYDDYNGYDYGYGGDMGYGMGSPRGMAFGGRGRSMSAAGRGGRGMGMRGARGGAARGGMMSGMGGGPSRGRGRSSGGRGLGGGMRGTGGLRGVAVKRKAADTFSLASEAKRMATGAGDPWSDDSWAAQPIAQQPLAEAEWYQDTW